VDLFRGRIRTHIELGKVDRGTYLTSWIRGDKLLVPSFSSSRGRSGIRAHDLETGASSTPIELKPDEELHSVVQHAGRDYLITVANSTGSRGRGGGVHSFDAELGSLQTIVDLRPGDLPLGISSGERVRLDDPFLFLYSHGSASRPVSVHAIHLPYERRWVYSLPVPGEQIYDRGMPLPAISTECVVFAFVTKNLQDLPDVTHLELVDRNGGFRLGGLSLPRDFTRSAMIELRGLGQALFVAARDPRGGVSGRLQILEDVR
jgi:hypothetical protein